MFRVFIIWVNINLTSLENVKVQITKYTFLWAMEKYRRIPWVLLTFKEGKKERGREELWWSDMLNCSVNNLEA